MDEILNGYFLQVFTFVCINIILALTVYMTVCTGILSLGNAGFMSLGAYTSAIVTTQYGVPMPVGIVLGGLFATLIALIIGLPTIRLRGLYLAIATMGFGEVVRVIALNLDITHGALGFSGIPSMASVLSDYASDMGLLDALEIDSQTGGQLLMNIVLLIIVVAVVTFWYRLEHSRIGRAWAAVKADEYAASLTGINVVEYKMMAFLNKVVDILVYTVFGGSNVLWGSVLGATVLTIVPESLRAMAEYRDIIYGLMLVALMAFRPDGILSYDAVKWISRKFSKKQKASAEGGNQ